MSTPTTTTTTAERPISSAEEAAALSPEDWYHVVYEGYRRASYLLTAYAKRDDLGIGRVSIDKLAEQIEVGQRHDNRRFGEQLRANGREPITDWCDRPCCDHVEQAELRVAELEQELADVRAALVLADTALNGARR